MNHFVRLIDKTPPGSPVERYVVTYHSAILLDTMIRGAAVDFAARVRNSHVDLAVEVADLIESNAKEARVEIRRGEFWRAHHLLALNLALAAWLIEDTRTEVVGNA